MKYLIIFSIIFLASCGSSVKERPFVVIDTPQALYLTQRFGATISQPIQRTITGHVVLDTIDMRKEFKIDTTFSVWMTDSLRDAKGKAQFDSLGKAKFTTYLTPLPSKYLQLLTLTNH